MTQMSRTQPPPTAPPTIISIGRASVESKAGAKRAGGGGETGVMRKERDEMGR